jgi:Ca2+-binding EF-hand superfamily protein
MTLFDDLDGAFLVVEQRFSTIDRDGGGTLSFEELHAELLKDNFEYGDKLAELFVSVDRKKEGALHFPDFMALLYMFVSQYGAVDTIVRNPADALKVGAAIQFMEQAMLEFDGDRDRKLSSAEVYAFFNKNWPEALEHQVVQKVLHQMFGEIPCTSIAVSLRDFMHILYAVTAMAPQTRLQGTYLVGRTAAAPVGLVPQGRPEQSPLWIRLENAFQVLEMDFKLFDVNKDGLVDVRHIYNVIPATTPSERELCMSRIQSKLPYVGLGAQAQGSSLDFFQYVLLGMYMTQDGSYLDLQPSSTNASVVKRCFMDLNGAYRHFDADKNDWLTADEIVALFRHCFGHGTHPSLQPAFEHFQYNPMPHAGGQPALDRIRYIKVLYVIIRPQGAYNPAVAQPMCHN